MNKKLLLLVSLLTGTIISAEKSLAEQAASDYLKKAYSQAADQHVKNEAAAKRKAKIESIRAEKSIEVLPGKDEQEVIVGKDLTPSAKKAMEDRLLQIKVASRQIARLISAYIPNLLSSEVSNLTKILIENINNSQVPINYLEKTFPMSFEITSESENIAKSIKGYLEDTPEQQKTIRNEGKKAKNDRGILLYQIYSSIHTFLYEKIDRRKDLLATQRSESDYKSESTPSFLERRKAQTKADHFEAGSGNVKKQQSESTVGSGPVIEQQKSPSQGASIATSGGSSSGKKSKKSKKVSKAKTKKRGGKRRKKK